MKTKIFAGQNGAEISARRRALAYVGEVMVEWRSGEDAYPIKKCSLHSDDAYALGNWLIECATGPSSHRDTWCGEGDAPEGYRAVRWEKEEGQERRAVLHAKARDETYVGAKTASEVLFPDAPRPR